MTDELKPCPFCGDKAEVYERPNYVLVGCSGEKNEVCDLITCSMTPEEWNTRPIEDALLAACEAMFLSLAAYMDHASPGLGWKCYEPAKALEMGRAAIAAAKGSAS
jgi:hypothetical protein